MNSTLKMIIPIVLVFGVVFAVTVIKKIDNTPPADTFGTDTPSTTMPLQFSYTKLKYDPQSSELWNRNFEAFHEVSDVERPACFWFRQTALEPTLIRVLGRSCTSCSSARVATIPQEAMDKFVQNVAADLPMTLSPLPVPDLFTALAMAELTPAIAWHEFDFTNQEDTAKLPAATDADHPIWGLFQMGVKIGAAGPKTLTATVGMKTESMQVPTQVPLSVTFFGMNPFEVIPPNVDLGQFPEGTSPRPVEVYYWSATRTPDAASGEKHLPPPTLVVVGDDPFVTLSQPEKVHGADLEALARRLSVESESPIPVSGAYRVAATVHRQLADGREPEIGPFEKTIGITGPGVNNSRRVTIKGVTTGLVSLVNGDTIKLGNNGQWNIKYGDTTEVELVSDRPELQLELVSEEIAPNFLRVTLGEPVDRSGRRYWTLKIVVPPNAGAGSLPRDAAIVLRSKGPKPQKVRIPVQGQGFRRG